MNGLHARVLAVPLAASLQMAGRVGGRTRSSLTVVPPPDRGEEYLARCVLRGIGKSPAAGKFSDAGRTSMATACSWLIAEGIEDLVILNADWLEDEDVLPVSDLSEAARVWLLTDLPDTHELVERFGKLNPHSASTESLDFWLQADMEKPEDLWHAFPRVPLADPLTFRGRCAQVFDKVEMVRIDALMRHGAADAMDILRKPGPDSMREIGDVIFTPVLPVWPAICNLRGAQLGALLSKHRLEISIDDWMAHRSELPTLGATAQAALSARPDPQASLLLAIASITGADPETLSRLDLKAISKHRDVVEVDGTRYRIPRALRSHAVAHLELRRREAGPHDALFVTPERDRQSKDELAAAFHAIAISTACGGEFGKESANQLASSKSLRTTPRLEPRERPRIELRKLNNIDHV